MKRKIIAAVIVSILVVVIFHNAIGKWIWDTFFFTI
jgi:hypothetical protein